LIKIKDAIKSESISGFMCESFITQEAIARNDRARYHAETKPIIQVKDVSCGPGLRHMSITIETDHALHPGLSERSEKELNAALTIGMKLLSAPLLNVPLPDHFRKNTEIYAPGLFETADYNERFGDCVRVINARGVGEGVLIAYPDSAGEGGISNILCDQRSPRRLGIEVSSYLRILVRGCRYERN
jgi:hypothetical protein